jgi:putative DNA primase/helicase
VGDSAIVSAKAGVGKTFFGMEVAKSITLTGHTFAGRWESPKPRRVVYLDGEMGERDMKERIRTMNLDTEFFIYVDALNQEETVQINLADLRFQDAIMRLMKDSESDVLIIDNLNMLYFPGEKSNSAEYMDAMNDFIKNLRKENIAVIIIDHEGKGVPGSPCGTSAKVRIAHVAVTLERPEWAGHSDGAHFIVRFTKRRGFHGEAAAPFVAELRDGQWEVSEVPDSSGSGSKPESSQKKRKSEAYQIFEKGGGVSKVITELKVSQATAYNYLKEWKAEEFGRDALPEAHAEFDAFGG